MLARCEVGVREEPRCPAVRGQLFPRSATDMAGWASELQHP